MTVHGRGMSFETLLEISQKILEATPDWMKRSDCYFRESEWIWKDRIIVVDMSEWAEIRGEDDPPGFMVLVHPQTRALLRGTYQWPAATSMSNAVLAAACCQAVGAFDR